MEFFHTPPDQAAVSAVRAEPGEMPAGGIASQSIVTGVVVAVDAAAKTISLVIRAAASCATIHVKNPRAQAQLLSVQPGDRVTSIFRDIIVGLVENPS